MSTRKKSIKIPADEDPVLGQPTTSSDIKGATVLLMMTGHSPQLAQPQAQDALDGLEPANTSENEGLARTRSKGKAKMDRETEARHEARYGASQQKTQRELRHRPRNNETGKCTGESFGKFKRVVLAYSGGRSSTIIVPWLRETYNCEVVCLFGDIGQLCDEEAKDLEAKAIASGATEFYPVDLKDEFVKDYIFPCLRAGAMYKRKYLLGRSLAWPLIAKTTKIVAKARSLTNGACADAVAHGSLSHNQERFELAFAALKLKLPVIAPPWREWDIKDTESAIKYANDHNIAVTEMPKKSVFSRDIWHISHAGDPKPLNDTIVMSVNPEEAPDIPESVTITITNGLPVACNGNKLPPVALLENLNDIGRKHAIGRIDMVENRPLELKSRCVYETPGVTILASACRELEALTLDTESMEMKDILASKYAELVYSGRWFDPFRESLDEFMKAITKQTTGKVTLKLCKGSVTVTRSSSPNSKDSLPTTHLII